MGLCYCWHSCREHLQPSYQTLVEEILLFAFLTRQPTVKHVFQIDDALDLFAEHGIGGMIGLLLNGFFGSSEVIALDGLHTSTSGGWIDHNWKQLYIQFAYVCACTGYSFVMTAFIAKCLDRIPGLHFRNTLEAERLGMDEVEVCIAVQSTKS